MQGFYKSKKLIPLGNLLDDEKFWKYDDLITYPKSGSFVKYLIDYCGLEIFKKLYKELKSNLPSAKKEKIIEITIGKPLKELEKDWLGHIKK